MAAAARRFVASLFALHAAAAVLGVTKADDQHSFHDPKDWWKKIVFYQIYPRSFQDSDGDGIGDIKGIESRLDYVDYVGFGAIWLSPIYKSPMKDFGYDVENYTLIDPSFGTMEDMDTLIRHLNTRGIKLLMDFVPNHSSDQSEWFKKSVKKEDPFTDYYMWMDGKTDDDGKRQPPNNWLSMFGGSAWEWNEERQQYYYHQFVKEQPDFNVTNPAIREELKNVIRFWLEKGVAGFRIDAIKHLFEDPQLRDEPLTNDPAFGPDEYGSLKHIYTTSQPQVLDVLREWRQVFDDFEQQDGFHRVMLVEINETIPKTVEYFGNETNPMADVPFNFEMFKITDSSNARDVFALIKNWLQGIPESNWPNWIIGNHDQPRVANRTHADSVDAMNMINLLLRGTPVTYYGEEIGMVDTEVSWQQTQDPFGLWFGEEKYKKYSRDPERTPMQWNARNFSGFTDGTKPWLPVNPNYKRINVEVEKKSPRSHLQTYRRLIALRNSPAGQMGGVHYPFVDDNILSFTRTLRGAPGILVVINFGSETENVDVANGADDQNLPFDFPRRGSVQALSYGSLEEPDMPQLGFYSQLDRVVVGPRKGVVIFFEPIW